MPFALRPLMPKLAAVALLAFGAATIARADETSLRAGGGWSRPTATAGMAGVAYLTITDAGAPTALVRVSTPIAAQAEMHRSLEQNGMMEMLPVKSMPIAPGSPIQFSPGGYHIMLMGLSKPLAVGQQFPLTLTFADGRNITATVTVQPMTAPPPSAPKTQAMME